MKKKRSGGNLFLSIVAGECIAENIIYQEAKIRALPPKLAELEDKVKKGPKLGGPNQGRFPASLEKQVGC